ncbi:MAG TPA: PqqD family protein [Pseudolabrys sp.]
MSLTAESIIVQETGLSAAEIDGRTVILSLDAGSYFDFNRVATEIWSMLREPCRVAEILQKLSQCHDVAAEVLSRDVMTFLQSLISQRLVRVIVVEDTR